MEEQFTLITQRIFSNWTALQLAVEHHMGGPKSQEQALEFANYVAQYCTSGCSSDDLQVVLEDILDQEFDTLCEDDSPKVISELLENFIKLWRSQNWPQFEVEVNNLPPIKDWLTRQPTAQQQIDSSSDDDDDESGETPMEEVEPGWTQVKTRRKR